MSLTPAQEIALSKAHTLLGFDALAAGKPHHLTRKDLFNAVYAVTDTAPSEDLVNTLMDRFSSDKQHITLDEFRSLVTCGTLQPEHTGRHWVAVSLAEAETIRRIIHIRQKANKAGQPQPLINNASTEIALHYSLMNGPGAPLAGDGGVILDASRGWLKNGNGATLYEAAKAHNSFRFFDCDMHYAPSALNILVAVVQGRYVS